MVMCGRTKDSLDPACITLQPSTKSISSSQESKLPSIALMDPTAQPVLANNDLCEEEKTRPSLDELQVVPILSRRQNRPGRCFSWPLLTHILLITLYSAYYFYLMRATETSPKINCECCQARHSKKSHHEWLTPF